MAFGYDKNLDEEYTMRTIKVRDTERGTTEETVDSILRYPCDAWPERGIKKETMERFGCRIKYSQENRSIESVYFPCYNAKGNKIIGFQKKNLKEPKEGDFHFTAVGTVRTTCQMYGQPQATGGKKLYITEGWVDLMTVYQCLKENNNNPKYAKLEPNVVSVVNGCANAEKSVAKNEDFVRQYPEIHLCFDNDQRTEIDEKSIIKGVEATEAVGAYLSADNVYTIPWPGVINDANDYYLDPRFGSEKMNKLLAFNTNKYQPEKVVRFLDVMTIDDILKPVERGLYIPAFPQLMDRMLGIRLRELTTTTAKSGVGKSTIGAEILHEIATQGQNCGLLMLEENLKKTMNRFIARKMEIHPNLYKFDPYCKGHSREEIIRAIEWTNDMFYPVDHYGAINTKSLLAKIKALYYVHGCKYILFDHISLAMTGQSADERKAIDEAMEKLGSFCSSNDVHIIVVSHLNRNASSGQRVEVKEPTWRRVYKEDLRGSSSLEGVSWNIIGIDSEDLPDATRGRIRLSLLKNREADDIGACDITKMHRETGLFYDASEEIWTPQITDGY